MVAKTLLLNGADFDAQDVYRHTPAHAAEVAALSPVGPLRHQPPITQFLLLGGGGGPVRTPSPSPEPALLRSPSAGSAAEATMSPAELAGEIHKLFDFLNVRWVEPGDKRCCYRGTWLAKPCRDWIIGLLLALRRVDDRGGPHVPVEMVFAVLRVMQGRDFVVRSDAGTLLA